MRKREPRGSPSMMAATEPSAAANLVAPASSGTGLRHVAAKFKILLPFAALVAAWWAIKASGDLPDRILVSPARVAVAFVELVSHGVLAEYASTSLAMIGTTALISLAIGVPIGLLIAIVWFGFTHTTTLVVVIYTLIVPIIFNTMVGVRAIPESYSLALSSLGAGRLRLVTD